MARCAGRAGLALLSGKFPGVQGAWEERTLQLPLPRRRVPPTRPPKKRRDRSDLQSEPRPEGEKGRRPGGWEGRCAGSPAPAEGRPRLGRAHRGAGVRARPRPGLCALQAPPPPRAAGAAGGGDSPLRRPEARGAERAERGGGGGGGGRAAGGPGSRACSAERPPEPRQEVSECLARVVRRALRRPALWLLPSLRPSSARASVPGTRCGSRKTPPGSRPGGRLLPASAGPCSAPPRSAAFASGLSGPAGPRPPAPRGRARVARPCGGQAGPVRAFLCVLRWITRVSIRSPKRASPRVARVPVSRA